VGQDPSVIVEAFKNGRTWATNQRNHSEHKLISLKEIRLLRLWSKNYDKLIELEKSDSFFYKMKNAVYIFMLNGVGGRESQPNDIDYNLALSQIEELSKFVDPKSIIIDYSPIYSWCPWGEMEYNSVYFEEIASKAAEVGINKCLYGFLDRNSYYSANDIFGNDLMIAGLSDSAQEMISSLLHGTASKIGIELFPKAIYEDYSYDIGTHLNELIAKRKPAIQGGREMEKNSFIAKN